MQYISSANLVKRYPPQAAVNVWYNPESPTEAVLERGAGGGNYVGIVLGLLLLAGSVWWLWSGGVRPPR